MTTACVKAGTSTASLLRQGSQRGPEDPKESDPDHFSEASRPYMALQAGPLTRSNLTWHSEHEVCLWGQRRPQQGHES